MRGVMMTKYWNPIGGEYDIDTIEVLTNGNKIQAEKIAILTEALQNLASDYRRTQMGRYMNTQDWVDEYMDMARELVEKDDGEG
jgi:hypothetical protein